MKKKFLILPFILICVFFFSLFLFCTLSIAPEETMVEWISIFGADSSDFGGFVQETFDYGYIILGDNIDNRKYQLQLIKTDEQGNKIWHKFIYEHEGLVGNYIQQTSDKGFIIVGQAYITRDPDPINIDIYLIKTGVNGNRIWSKTFGREDKKEEGCSIQQTSDGGYIILGEIEGDISNNPYNIDIYLLKTDKTGNKIWEKTFGGNGIDRSYVLHKTTDGGYIIAGYTHSPSIGDGVYLFKTDSEGNQIWDKVINLNYGKYDSPTAYIHPTVDGGYIVLSTIKEYKNNWTNYDFYLMKLDSEGNTIWNKRYGEFRNWEKGFIVKQTSDEGFLLAGSGGLFIKTGPSGEIMWERVYHLGEVGIAEVVETHSGGYVIGGTLIGYEDYGYGFIYLMKIGE